MDLDKFLNESFAPRQVTVKVPEIADYFGEDEAVWTVRGLTAAELGRANESADRGAENNRALIDALTGDGDKAAAFKKALGISDAEVPADVSRRIELLTAGSVSPAIGIDKREVVVRLAETFPTVFYNLSTQILSLTGQGAEVGKRKPSGSKSK
jgi:hypothetical protein